MAGSGDTSVSIAIDLESNAAPIARDSAAALEQLKGAISSSSSELAGMNKALRALKGGAGQSDDTIKKLKQQIAATKATLAGNVSAFVKAGGSFKEQKKPLEESKGAFARLAAEMSGLPGPVGTIISKMGGLGKVLAIGAAVAFAAALIAVAAAAAAAAISLAAYALSAADARRSEELRLQGLSKFRNFWAEMVTGQGRAADSSGFLQKQLDEVAASSALGRDRIAEMQGELYRAGLRSGNLQAALEGLAIAESTQGAEGAAQFKARAIGAALYGTSVKKVADDIKARLGGVAKAQMLSLDVQTRKLRENMQLLFKDLHIEKLLEGIGVITSMFSQTTASGRALKALIDGFFQPLADSAAAVGIYVKRFFQGVIIGALTFGIMVLRVRNYLRDTFGEPAWLKSLDKQKIAVQAGAAAFFVLAGAVILGAVAFGLLGAAVVSVFAAIAAITYGVVAGVGAVIDAIVRLKDWMKGQALSFEGIGMSIAKGIANGIRSGVGLVVDAMKELAERPMAIFKSALRIRSPSGLARDVSKQVPAGTVIEYRAAVPRVKAAARDMAAATESGMREGSRGMSADAPAMREAPQRGGAAVGARSVSLTIAEGAIRVEGARDPDEVAKEIVMQIEERIVNAAREMGAAG